MYTNYSVRYAEYVSTCENKIELLLKQIQISKTCKHIFKDICVEAKAEFPVFKF